MLRHLSKLLSSWIVPCILFVSAISYFSFQLGSPVRLVQCLIFEQASSPWLKTNHMFSCSNVRQQILLNASENVEKVKTDVDGWEMWKAKDVTTPAVLAVKFTRDRQHMIFYPRVSGELSAVAVYEGDKNGLMKRITSIRGANTSWSDIGHQCSLNLNCIEHGSLTKEFDVILYFVMTGPWSQIWSNGQNILF